MKFWVCVLGVILCSVSPSFNAQEVLPSLPSDAEILSLLSDFIDVRQQSLGTVVGIVSPTGRRVVAVGHAARGGFAVDGDTLFEIGSVTKVFTALLLTDSARRGEVSIDDPVAKHLQSIGKMSAANGRPMTLADLATHTSGLPFWPSNIPPNAEGAQRMASYTVAELFAFVSAFEEPAEVGTRWAYSNMDAGLLGLALAQRASISYDALLHRRITEPLGMTGTVVTVAPSLQSRLATGHDKALDVAPRWEVPSLVGAGSVHSTVNDLLTFLDVTMGLHRSPLSESMAAMLKSQRKGPAFQQALGWWIFNDADGQIVTHVGGTLGFSSQIAYDPKTQVGVVVLSNSVAPVNTITTQILRPSASVSPVSK